MRHSKADKLYTGSKLAITKWTRFAVQSLSLQHHRISELAKTLTIYRYIAGCYTFANFNYSYPMPWLDSIWYLARAA